MKTLIAVLLFVQAFALASVAHAQPREFQQAELDALLAPVALYPDPLLSQVLIAATYPDDVREAAAWSRANAHLKGDEAVRAAHAQPWDASIKALLAYPDLLARMEESPQWTEDLGEAFLAQEPQVMETVQALRRRAQASGHLQSDSYQTVQQYDDYVVVQPAYANIVYVPWYNPLVVYGPWWWHSHHPIAWRPWRPRPVTYFSHFYPHRPVLDWHRRYVHRPYAHKPYVREHRPIRATRPQPHPRAPLVHNHVHQATTARPIIQGARLPERSVWSNPAQRALQQQAPRALQQHPPRAREQGARQGSRGGEQRMRQGNRGGGDGRGQGRRGG